MRITNTSQVLCPRTVVQVFQHAVSTRVVVVLANLAIQVVQIAKADRARWTSVLASGRDFVGADRTTAFVLGLDFDVLDSLYTVSTLLHHTATSNRNVRVHHQALHLQISRLKLVCAGVFDKRLSIAVVQVVKATDFVRTVVTAVTSTDTAVVNHVVQAFVRVNGRGNRTNGFARSVFAVVTSYRLVNDLVVVVFFLVVVGVQVATVVAVDANPMQLAASPNFCFADNRDVVF